MFTSEVHINVPCSDHLDHVSRISPLKYRMSEDVVKIYAGKPEVTCTAVGSDALTTARNTVVYNVGDVKMLDRWPLPNGAFEWFASMDEVSLKRVNVQVTHCVRVEIDAYVDRDPTTTVIWKRSQDDEYQEERVMGLVDKLAPDLSTTLRSAVAVLKKSPGWRSTARPVHARRKTST